MRISGIYAGADLCYNYVVETSVRPNRIWKSTGDPVYFRKTLDGSPSNPRNEKVIVMSNQEQHPLAKWFGERKIVRLMLLAALLALGLVHFDSIVHSAQLLWRIAQPLILGAMMAYVLDIVVKRLEGVLFPRAKDARIIRSRRALAILIALLVVLSILTLIIFTVIPGLTQAVTLLAQALPVYFAELKQWLLTTFRDVPTITDYVDKLELDWNDVQGHVIAWAMNGMNQGLISSTVTVIGAVTGRISNFLISSSLTGSL